MRSSLQPYLWKHDPKQSMSLGTEWFLENWSVLGVTWRAMWHWFSSWNFWMVTCDAVSAVILAAYAKFTYDMLQTEREKLNAQLQPYVVASLQPDPTLSNAVTLHIQNAGGSTAYNLNGNIELLDGDGSEDLLEAEHFFEKGAETLAPGYEFQLNLGFKNRPGKSLKLKCKLSWEDSQGVSDEGEFELSTEFIPKKTDTDKFALNNLKDEISRIDRETIIDSLKKAGRRREQHEHRSAMQQAMLDVSNIANSLEDIQKSLATDNEETDEQPSNESDEEEPT